MSKSLAKSLEHVLADTYAIYLKTQNYHWNVEGPHFRSLHLMFEDHYDDLFKAIDVAAELIRQIGYKVPATFGIFAKNTKIKDGDENLSAEKMLKDLLADHEAIQKTLMEALEEAHKANDEAVAAFLGERLSVHKKNAWFIRSTLA